MSETERNPFAPNRSPGRRVVGIGLFVLASIAVFVILARGRREKAAASHDGHATAPPADSAAPVALTPSARQRIGVTFAAVREGSLDRIVRVVGLVKEDETRVRVITTRVDGFVEALEADFTGRLVRAGEPMLGLYAPEVVAAETELLLAIDLERSVNAASPEARASAARGVTAARQRLRFWNVPDGLIARVEQRGTAERLLPVHSPWDGFVLEKNVLLGQRVMAGDPLFRMADLSVVWIEGEVFEQDMPLVRLGGSVIATFQGLPGVERRGRVSYVYPTVDPATRTARIRVEFRNETFTLKPGMYASLQLSGTLPASLTVPRSAIVSTGTRNLVFLKRPDGMFEPREVVLGASTADDIEVLRGLVRGDTVVASGTFLLDAESNLRSLLGGMGDMPGMDMAPPRPHAHEKR